MTVPVSVSRSIGDLRVLTEAAGPRGSLACPYVPDGSTYVTLAMNGWADPAPAWWLNLKARPEALAETVDGPRRVRAREATGAECERLWTLLAEADDGWGDLDDFAARRSHQTPVVVLEVTEPAS
ncbi:nitroreductase family deazaflavin-dependent oxidoreductase [Nocardioides sp. KC13]|uniref:Nitroreductase family deazaflavin-dependent oxidoreductase n=1 Tax=Nocardioides turkmenicus TaxID=2711220 RepID=A0A6M1QRM1_9ACTN|nr:nitroreductase family deazaflavin-dependent oxidoreductase [Nocardioides sp. KC13]